MMWREPDSKSITNPSAKTSASSHFYYKPSQNSTNAARKKNQINLFFTLQGKFKSICVTPPTGSKYRFPHPIIMFSFWLQKSKNIRHLYVIKHPFFKTFRARISKMSYRQFEALWYLRIKKEKKSTFWKQTLHTPTSMYYFLSFLLVIFIQNKRKIASL